MCRCLVGDHAAKEDAQNAVKEVKEVKKQFRVLKGSLEVKLGAATRCKLSDEMPHRQRWRKRGGQESDG